MKFAKNITFFIFSLLFFNTINAQYIQVDDNSFTATELIENVLVNSPCANVSNVSVSGWSFSSGNSYGYFTANGSSFPFQDGVIISTGRAISAIGPNNSLLSEGPTNWPGDNDLQQAINESNTINATVIEFDFLPFANKISFEYIFSSEQYLSNPNSNQCSYSDGFAFLLREVSSSQYINLAVVPGTSTPVKVPTVRGSGTICPPANEQYFDAFNGIAHPTNFNGQTKILKAESNVIPGQLYHIKLVIADQGNNLYDSAIFLGGGSFTVETDLGPDRLISNNSPLCENETLVLDATTPNAIAYRWYRNNQLLIGETGPTYTVTQFGFYKVEVQFNASCFSTGEITIEYVSNPTPNSVTLTQCDDNNDGIAYFNLTDAYSAIIGSNTNVQTPRFFFSQSDAELNINTISTTTPFLNTSVNQLLYVRLQNIYGCFSISTVTLSTSNSTLVLPSSIICDNDDSPDGITTFSLSSVVTPNISSLFPNGSQLTYYASSTDAQLQQNAFLNSFTNTTPFEQTIYVRVANGTTCLGIFPLVLEIKIFTPIGLEDETIYLCEGETISIGVLPNFSSYLWDTGETTPTIFIDEAGTYTITVSNSEGCTVSKKFTILLSGPPTIDSIIINDFSGNQNSLTINVLGFGDYVYSLDGSYFQNSPIFQSVPAGEYWVIVKDLNGCGIRTQKIIVLDYPKFFTPNGDGIHDIWKIEKLADTKSSIAIFDRYGKLIVQFNPSIKGWDGNFNNVNMPSSDYWFILTLSDGRIIKGHFALKR
ncbi:MAG: T9SS type B sorting domain-containing protein [Flavobacteriales bacterium]|nr:T9SS type B sorting domain-containing protein [Flavobacteriales bacterium]